MCFVVKYFFGSNCIKVSTLSRMKGITLLWMRLTHLYLLMTHFIRPAPYPYVHGIEDYSLMVESVNMLLGFIGSIYRKYCLYHNLTFC